MCLAIMFCTLAAENRWKNESLADTFYFSLEIKNRLATVNLPSIFETLLELAIEVDYQL